MIDQAIMNFQGTLSYEQVVQAWNTIMPMFDKAIAGCPPDVLEASNRVKQFQEDIFNGPDAEQYINSSIEKNKKII